MQYRSSARYPCRIVKRFTSIWPRSNSVSSPCVDISVVATHRNHKNMCFFKFHMTSYYYFHFSHFPKSIIVTSLEILFIYWKWIEIKYFITIYRVRKMVCHFSIIRSFRSIEQIEQSKSQILLHVGGVCFAFYGLFIFCQLSISWAIELCQIIIVEFGSSENKTKLVLLSTLSRFWKRACDVTEANYSVSSSITHNC